MFGAMAVKHMAMDANINPPKKASASMRTASGLVMSPKTAMTVRTIAELIRLRVAPQRSSPPMTSSMLTGVVIIASNVFWKYIRTNEAYVHSKNEEFMIEMATNAGAMNWM